MHSIKKNSFQQIRLNDDEYNGHRFLDVRIYVKGEGGKYYPTRQGAGCPTGGCVSAVRGNVQRLCGREAGVMVKEETVDAYQLVDENREALNLVAELGNLNQKVGNI